MMLLDPSPKEGGESRMKRHRKPLTALLCAMLALGICAMPVAAQDDWGGETTEGWRTFLQYAGCAMGIAAAPTGIGVVVAVTGCLLLMTE